MHGKKQLKNSKTNYKMQEKSQELKDEKWKKYRKKNRLIITRLGNKFYKTKVYLQKTPDGKIIEHFQTL